MTSPAAMAKTNDVTDFQRRVLIYCEMHKRVGTSAEHALRMGVPRRNLELAVTLLRGKRMLALDATTGEYGLTLRGREALKT